jgi:GDP-mannose 6-dehydrogenase
MCVIRGLIKPLDREVKQTSEIGSPALRFARRVPSLAARMRISVFGLGYVGAVTAAGLAKRGHGIVGVDVRPHKVELFNQGQSPVHEPGLDELLRAARAGGRLRATGNAFEAVTGTDLSVVCVGTPSTVTGSLDLSSVRQVLKEIRGALRSRPKPHALVIRSAMLPGSTGRLVSELLVELEAAGTLSICYHPEFLREGTAVTDFEDPSLTLIGTRQGGKPPALVCDLVVGGPPVVVNWQTAELVKYACSAFHATKVAFANEVGRMAKGMQLDGCGIMELLCRDTRLNLSPVYLKPGNPFGGPYLPRDVRALAHQGRLQGMNLPLLESLPLSNERHLQSLLSLIAESGCQEVIILGLALNAETDDLRESPMVEVAQALLGRGYRVRIYDPQLNPGKAIGNNGRSIQVRMPHLASLLHADLAQALGDRGLVVAAQRCASLRDLAKALTARHRVLDVYGWPELRELPVSYEGLCW